MTWAYEQDSSRGRGLRECGWAATRPGPRAGLEAGPRPGRVLHSWSATWGQRTPESGPEQLQAWASPSHHG